MTNDGIGERGRRAEKLLMSVPRGAWHGGRGARPPQCHSTL